MTTFTSEQLSKKIKSINAVDLNNGFFSIQADLGGEGVIVLLPKSKRQPTNVQLFLGRANGNCKDDSHGKFFTFTKSTKNAMYPSKHLKSFLVNH